MTEATVATPTSTATPAPAGGMKGGPSSIDDLMKAYDEAPAQETATIEAEAEKQVKVKEVAEKKQAAKEVVKKLEENSGSEDTEVGDEGSADPLPEGADEVGKDVEATDKAPQTFLAEVDGKEVEIPPAAALTFEVNGKPFTFTVKDAIEAKMGQEDFNRNMHKRLSFADQREKRAEARIQGVLSKAQEVIKASASGEFMPALKAIVKMAAAQGHDPVKIEQQFLENLAKIKQVYLEMTPEQQAKYFAERRAEEAEKRAAELEGKVGLESSMRETAKQIETLCSEWELTPDQFTGLYEIIGEKLVGEGKRFASIDDVGAEQVIQVHHELTSKIKIEQALNRVDKALLSDREFVENLYEQVLQNPKWKADDVEYIVKQIVSTPSRSVQNLNRKVEKAKSQRLNSALKEGSAAKKGDEDEFDRDLERRAQRAGWAGRVR